MPPAVPPHQVMNQVHIYVLLRGQDTSITHTDTHYSRICYKALATSCLIWLFEFQMHENISAIWNIFIHVRDMINCLCFISWFVVFCDFLSSGIGSEAATAANLEVEYECDSINWTYIWAEITPDNELRLFQQSIMSYLIQLNPLFQLCILPTLFILHSVNTYVSNEKQRVYVLKNFDLSQPWKMYAVHY